MTEESCGPDDESKGAPHSHLVVGHVCLDEFPGSELRLGGTSYYASLKAAALGTSVAVLTACSGRTAGLLRSRLPSTVAVHHQPTKYDTTFEFSECGPTRLVSHAGSLLPTQLGTFRSAHLGPIAGEIPMSVVAQVRKCSEFVGVTPQGFMRRFSDSGKILLGDITSHELANSADAVVVNDNEVAVLKTSSTFLAEYEGPVFITEGPRGARVVSKGREVARVELQSSRRVRPEETIGAGDVFASTAFVLLAKGAGLGDALVASVEAATEHVHRKPLL